MENTNNNISLQILSEGLPTITKRFGEFLCEAATYCLSKYHHSSGVKLKLYNSICDEVLVHWDKNIDSRLNSTYHDDVEAVEYGASCIAIIIAVTYTGNNTVERSAKGTGIDFWIGDKVNNLPFQKKARLEISGINKGNEILLKSRVKEKYNQSKKSDQTKIPAYIAVIEFSNPIGSFLKRDVGYINEFK